MFQPELFSFMYIFQPELFSFMYILPTRVILLHVHSSNQSYSPSCTFFQPELFSFMYILPTSYFPSCTFFQPVIFLHVHSSNQSYFPSCTFFQPELFPFMYILRLYTTIELRLHQYQLICDREVVLTRHRTFQINKLNCLP